MALWKIDGSHSSATFSAKHMMVTTVRGTMRDISGTIDFDPANPAAATVEVSVPTHNFDTGFADRDNHLRSPDFLNIAEFPAITFKSNRVDVTSDNEAKVHGDLTIRGTTRPVVLDVEFHGTAVGPWGGAPKAGFTGTTKINRDDWGLNWNVALEAGGWLVGKDIKIELDVEAEQVLEEVPAV